MQAARGCCRLRDAASQCANLWLLSPCSRADQAPGQPPGERGRPTRACPGAPRLSPSRCRRGATAPSRPAYRRGGTPRRYKTETQAAALTPNPLGAGPPRGCLGGPSPREAAPSPSRGEVSRRRTAHAALPAPKRYPGGDGAAPGFAAGSPPPPRLAAALPCAPLPPLRPPAALRLARPGLGGPARDRGTVSGRALGAAARPSPPPGGRGGPSLRTRAGAAGRPPRPGPARPSPPPRHPPAGAAR